MAAKDQNETHRNLVDPDAGLETNDYKQVMNEESEGKSTLTHLPQLIKSEQVNPMIEEESQNATKIENNMFASTNNLPEVGFK